MVKLDDRTKRAVWFLNALRSESDRGCLLVALAGLDDALGELLLAEFHSRGKGRADLDKSKNAVPRGLDRRLTLAYALCLIDAPVRDAIDCLRFPRNEAAHLASPFDLGRVDFEKLHKSLPAHDTQVLQQAAARLTIRQQLELVAISLVSRIEAIAAWPERAKEIAAAELILSYYPQLFQLDDADAGE